MTTLESHSVDGPADENEPRHGFAVGTDGEANPTDLLVEPVASAQATDSILVQPTAPVEVKKKPWYRRPVPVALGLVAAGAAATLIEVATGGNGSSKSAGTSESSTSPVDSTAGKSPQALGKYFLEQYRFTDVCPKVTTSGCNVPTETQIQQHAADLWSFFGPGARLQFNSSLNTWTQDLEQKSSIFLDAAIDSETVTSDGAKGTATFKSVVEAGDGNYELALQMGKKAGSWLIDSWSATSVGN